MKAARLVVLMIAIGAGGLAFVLFSRDQAPPPPVATPVKTIETVEVLVARADMPIGHVVRPEDIGWETWPSAAASNQFIRRPDNPSAADSLRGAITRTPFVAGEPIRESKLIKAEGSGFMAAILPAGMRAISVEISPETGAGGFILPNDRVDVLLTRRDIEAERSNGGGQVYTSETVLMNVRVLAIDQTIEEKNGEKVVVGRTATLELSPPQTELLAQARQSGSLALALRSLADAKVSEGETERRRTGVTFIRFGVTSRISR